MEEGWCRSPHEFGLHSSLKAVARVWNGMSFAETQNLKNNGPIHPDMLIQPQGLEIVERAQRWEMALAADYVHLKLEVSEC